MQNAQGNINWEIFGLDERLRLEGRLAAKDHLNLVGMVEEMTPEKEIEIQKMVDMISPIGSEFESQVLKNFEADRAKKGLMTSPETPDEEAELQAAMDKELKEYQDAQVKKNEERIAKMESKPVAPVEAPEEVEKKKPGRPPKAKV